MRERSSAIIFSFLVSFPFFWRAFNEPLGDGTLLFRAATLRMIARSCFEVALATRSFVRNWKSWQHVSGGLQPQGVWQRLPIRTPNRTPPHITTALTYSLTSFLFIHFFKLLTKRFFNKYK